MPDVEEVRSISKTGLSVITIVFKDGTDIYFARQLVFEQLQTARANIPEGIGTPKMGINTSGLGMVFQYVLLADEDSNVDAVQLRSLNDWVVKLLLLPVDGVTLSPYYDQADLINKAVATVTNALFAPRGATLRMHGGAPRSP